jgi:hypothetical protein
MDAWPALPYADWRDTRDTLHLWTQLVGKVALSHSPRVNHWWNAGLQLTARGLGTELLYEADRAFEIRFDFIAHKLRIICSDGRKGGFDLAPMSVADFHRQLTAVLREVGCRPRIWPVAVEIGNPIRLNDDIEHASYDPLAAQRFWHVLLQVNRVLRKFRAGFQGKCSPVLFWWGTFDLAVTRFSGRPAPPREGADSILREAMSHEEISHGWWPGDESMPEPLFYAYASPEPAGIAQVPPRPPAAYYLSARNEFFLPYDAVRTAADPDAVLLDFLHSTYEAGAELARWEPALLKPAV